MKIALSPFWMRALTAALLAFAVFAAPSKTPAHHDIDPKQDCIACHGAKTALVQDASLPGCQGCHDARGLANAQELSLPGETGTDAALPPEVQMYYAGTHLGSQPGEMLRIPAGPFTRGTNSRLSDEGPEHILNLAEFWIDRTEVTNLQYEAFIKATDKRPPEHFLHGNAPPGKLDHPVTFVNWYNARDYCHWAGRRLPTDAEWEKAARGTDGRFFPWGDNFELSYANTPVRWVALKQKGDTTPVGTFPQGASPYGMMDASGNVWEWTSSWYEAYPGYVGENENFGHMYKVLKGGSWWDCSFYQCGISAPVFNRSFFQQRVHNSSFGFRCAADQPPVSTRQTSQPEMTQ